MLECDQICRGLMPWVVFLVGALVIFRSPTAASGYRLLMFVVGLLFILAGFVV